MVQFPVGEKATVTALAEDPVTGVQEKLQIVPQSAPDTSQLAADDVLIGVRSAGLSWVDLLMTSGQYQHQPPLPYSPGLEYSGDVLWVGADVDKAVARVGDRVFVDCLTTGPRTKGRHATWGGFASYAVAPAAAIHQVPEAFSYDQACNFAGSYETAYYCLLTRGGLKADETVMINGATGSTGVAAVQVALAVGAKVIVTGRRLAKLQPLLEMGAHHAVQVHDPDNPGEVRRFRDEVKEWTGGIGVDVVYDGVGGAVSLESLRCARFGARFLIVGWASTPDVARGRGLRGAPRANLMPTNLVLMKRLDVLGCPMVIGSERNPEIRPERLSTLFRWAEQGYLKPHISHTFPLGSAREALMAKWRGEITGGAVIHPPQLAD